MRLRTIVPPLPDDLLDALEEIGLRTDADLMFFGTPMELYQKLPVGTITLAALTTHIEAVIDYISTPATQASSLAHQPPLSADQFLSDVPQLDALTGGFGQGRVFEISGDRGSGKTALALQVVMRHLSINPNSSAVWVDTVGDFAAEKIRQTSERFSDLPAAETATDRLQISLAFDIETLQELLETFNRTFVSDSQENKVEFLIIDAITPIFRPLLSVVSSQGHAVMTTFMRQLRSLARNHPLTVMVLNGTSAAAPHNPLSAFSTTTRKPALGPTFSFMADTTLWLTRHKPETTLQDQPIDDDTYVAEVFRSRSAPSKTWCSFKLRGGVLYGE